MNFKLTPHFFRLFRRIFLQKLYISLLATVIFLLVIFTIFVFIQTSRQQLKPDGWERVGYDDNNTNFFKTKTVSRTQYQNWVAAEKTRSLKKEKHNLTSIWGSEEFVSEPYQLLGGIHKLNYNLRTCDINSDGDLEIIIGYHGQTIILNHQGVFQYALPYCFDVYVDEIKNVFTIACSLNVIKFSINNKKNQLLRTGDPVITAKIVKLKDFAEPTVEILTVEKISISDSTEAFKISCYDPATGQQRWFQNFNELPFISAIGDINQDGRNEIVCSSYVPDQIFCEIIALSSSGRFIWKYEFDMRNESARSNLKVPSYTDAAIADLNGDEKPEVVVIFGTEDGSLGRLIVIDAKTGKVIEQYPKQRFLQRSFTSLGISDLDHDGNSDIVVATRGRTARIYLFRLGNTGIETLATKRYFPLSIREPGMVSCWIWALGDIDDDNEIEILSSILYETPLHNDWTIRTTRFVEPSVIMLDEKLREKSNVDLDERCLGIIVSTLSKGSTKNILVLSDKLYLYALQ